LGDEQRVGPAKVPRDVKYLLRRKLHGAEIDIFLSWVKLMPPIGEAKND